MVEQRQVGRSDILVSRLGLGGVTFGREVDEAMSFRLLDHAVASGITLLDTARLPWRTLPTDSRCCNFTVNPNG